MKERMPEPGLQLQLESESLSGDRCKDGLLRLDGSWRKKFCPGAGDLRKAHGPESSFTVT